MEIERQFVIDAFPPLPVKESAVMRQGYLAVDPTVRIRSKETAERIDYKLCFKGEGTLAREEIELPLTAEVFGRLTELLKGALIVKEYRTYTLPGGLTLEASLVDPGAETAFLYAEVEFPTIEEALAFEPPSYLGQDVTERPGYGMSQYWERTRLSKDRA